MGTPLGRKENHIPYRQCTHHRHMACWYNRIQTHLVRKIFLIAAKSQYTISLKYIRGTNNVIADSLARFQMQKFWKVAPTNVNELPTEIPDIVWETLQATT